MVAAPGGRCGVAACALDGKTVTGVAFHHRGEAMQGQVQNMLTEEFGSDPAVVPLQTIFYSATKPVSSS